MQYLFYRIDSILVRATKSTKEDYMNDSDSSLKNQIMFGTYVKLIALNIQEIKSMSGNNDLKMKTIFNEFTELLNKQQSSGYLIIGESYSLMKFVELLFQVPQDEPTEKEKLNFITRLEIIKNYGTNFLMAISNALSYHCNPVLLKH